VAVITQVQPTQRVTVPPHLSILVAPALAHAEKLNPAQLGAGEVLFTQYQPLLFPHIGSSS